MKLTTFILIVALAQVSARGFGQKITLNTNHTPIEQVLQSIRTQSGYGIVYNARDLGNEKITLRLSNASVEDALNALVKDLPLTYKIVKTNILITRIEPSFLDRFLGSDDGAFADIRGVVRNEKGEAVEGVTVSLKGTNKGTTTNAKGEFLLKGVSDDAVLVFSGVNIESYEAKINGKKELNVNVRSRQVQLEEVTVNTGYQKISKERFVGSYSQLDSAAYSRRAGMGILDRLDGTVNGLVFNKKKR